MAGKERLTLALLLQRAFGGMARLEALLALLRRAAVVVVFGSHIAVAAATGLESEGNRGRHFECDASEMLRCCSKCGTFKIVDPLLNIFSGALVLSSALPLPESRGPPLDNLIDINNDFSPVTFQRQKSASF